MRRYQNEDTKIHIDESIPTYLYNTQLHIDESIPTYLLMFFFLKKKYFIQNFVFAVFAWFTFVSANRSHLYLVYLEICSPKHHLRRFLFAFFLDAECKSNLFKRRSKFFSCGAFSLLLIYEMTWKYQTMAFLLDCHRQSIYNRVSYQQYKFLFKYYPLSFQVV